MEVVAGFKGDPVFFFFFTNFPVGLMEVQSKYIKIYKNMEAFNVPSGACPIKTLLLSQTT